MAHSRGFGLDLEILKTLSRNRLIRILEEAPGSKELVIDGDLMKLLDRIADAKILRTHGVGKMFRFERVPPSTNIASCHLVYLIRPTLLNIKYVADHVHAVKIQTKFEIHVICVPRVVSWAARLIEEEGLHGIVILHEFTPDFIPLDEDLLSLEMNNFFKDSFLESDFSGCLPIARALNTLQSLYGPFVSVYGHGRGAAAVLKALKIIREDQQDNKSPVGSSLSIQNSQIGHLFIFDRDADYVTPLLTQLTYEGALDEHYGIRAGVVEFPKEVVGEDHPSKVPLNSRDTVYDNIRNRHFAGVSSHVARKARELQERKRKASTMSPSEMKAFVSTDLRTLQTIQKSLSLHISACEGITKNTRKDFDMQLVTEHGLVTGAIGVTEAKNYLDDCIARQLPSSLTLRLLCLLSITRQGLARKDFENFSSQIFSAYGYHHMLTLFKLRRMGLLLVTDMNEEQGNGGAKQKQMFLQQMVSSFGGKKSGNWQTLAKKLNLIPDGEEEIDLHNPTHMSYVFNGAYTPLIPHLLSESLTKGFSSILDVLKLLPGTTFASISSDGGNDLKGGSITPVSRVVLIVILGGVTFAEVAALRLLSVSVSRKIIIASTNTTTGSSLIKSAINL